MFRAFIAVFLMAGVSSASVGAAELRDYLVAASSQLDPRAQATLANVDGLGRQLLAVRGYLRAGSTLDQRWSWTQQQIDAYQDSPAQMARDAEIAKVRTVFEKNNPGYSLFVNPQVRSVDLQLQRWNSTDSIARAGDHMRLELEAAISADGIPPPGTAAGYARFSELLVTHSPQPVPTLAAPGLSAHGRMNAVDFQVQRGRRIIAGPDSTMVETMWIAGGWRDRLHAAVVASSHFTGPLANPAEPWHYDYQP
ncbi:MAG: hypothetical protein ABI616_00655 [Pseudomonadota bacterium]